MAVKKSTTLEEVSVIQIDKRSIVFHVLGTSPLILNSMSQKVKQDLLMPKGKKNAAEKASSLKHSPLVEYRASIYRFRDDSPTLIGLLSSMFKAALRGAALDMPGSSKAQIGRLTYVPGDMIPVYGVPQLLMSVTRSADMNRTPDIRTRAIMPEWAVYVTIDYVTPILKDPAIVNLLAAAGITQGIGDWRPEKGKGDYGQFRLVRPDDPNFLRIIAAGGRDVQVAAMDAPKSYDANTDDLFAWYNTETKRRGFAEVA